MSWPLNPWERASPPPNTPTDERLGGLRIGLDMERKTLPFLGIEPSLFGYPACRLVIITFVLLWLSINKAYSFKLVNLKLIHTKIGYCDVILCVAYNDCE
jgi:hypothetical protein